jgi:hypothetical protein
MIALRRDGVTLEEIGQRYGVTRERARQITASAVTAAEARAARGKAWLTEDQVRAAILKYRSQTLAAAALGVTAPSISAAIKRFPALRPLWRNLPNKFSLAGLGMSPETMPLARRAFELRQQGLSYTRIATVLGKNNPSEGQRLVLLIGPDPLGRVGAKRPRKLTPEVVVKVRELWDAGHSKTAIGAAVGVRHAALKGLLP